MLRDEKERGEEQGERNGREMRGWGDGAKKRKNMFLKEESGSNPVIRSPVSTMGKK